MAELTRTSVQNSVDVTANKTLAIADCGIVQNITATGKTITLPSTAAGLSFTIRNGGAGDSDGEITLNVSPAAADKISGGPTGTPTDNKDLINTSGRGAIDELQLVGDGVDGWVVVRSSGTWTREA